jgi:hypothetical protein
MVERVVEIVRVGADLRLETIAQRRPPHRRLPSSGVMSRTQFVISRRTVAWKADEPIGSPTTRKATMTTSDRTATSANPSALTRADCEHRDANDPLRKFRGEFLIPEDTIYLDGNSLGPRTKGAAERAQDVITDEWGTGLIGSWNTAGWWDLPAKLGEKVAGLVGGGAGSTVVTDTTSINLFKAASAALKMQAEDSPNRRIILTQRENFSLRYLHARRIGRAARRRIRSPPRRR